ncbi:MAG: major capsid protein [Microvirus sp.]|nr:MAG: major capsid protein [Microvirus sp.]
MKFFDQKVKLARVKKSKFDLSHEKKLTLNMGKLVPILCQDVMPGDSFRVSTEQMMRIAPMIAPMMHRVNVYMHYFFVPNRLVWNEWEDFITGGQPGSARPVFPTINAGEIWNSPPQNDWHKSSLADYLGVPTYGDKTTIVNATFGQPISALPFRAYQLIWGEYFRDQDLQGGPQFKVDKTSGPVPTANYGEHLTLRNRCWEKDYGTSSRPQAQKGGAVSLPFSYADVSSVVDVNGNAINTDSYIGNNAGGLGGMSVGKTSPTDGLAGRIENIEALATINEFREANALQRFLEKLSRSGNRYIEYIKMIFHETSSDSRLQRPEYLGGGRAPIVISEVLSTYDNTTGGLPQGTMSGHGIAIGNTNGFTQKFNEHGYIIGLMSVLPRTGYQQSLERHWTRKDQFDFPIPDFAHLGEQAVHNHEIYLDYVAGLNDQTFGYQSRYSECKFKNSTSHGDFRDNLLFYTMDRIFATRPALNSIFVESDPTTRVFAITDPDIDHLWCNLHHSISAVRPLPYNGIPTL